MNALTIIEPADLAFELEVFSSVPEWARVLAVADRSTMPLFRPGEVVVFQHDPKRIPEDGKLYVVEYGGHPIAPGRNELSPRRSSIAQAHRGQMKDGQIFWSFRSYAGPIHWADGWYPDEYAMAEKVLGTVIGIYAPSGSVRP